MRIPLRLISAILALGIVFSHAAAQVPADFRLVASAGGVNAFQEHRSLVVDANGAAVYARYIPSRPGQTLDRHTFTLSSAELASLWQTIQNEGFLSLDASYEEPLIHDRTEARLVVTANGTTHQVRTRNIAVPAFDAVMAALNAVTPGERDLVYVTTPFTPYPSRDVCDGYGGVGKGGYVGTDLVLAGKSNAVGPWAPANNADAHAGTVISHTMSLQQAVQKGLVSLEGKGGYFGDRVAIEGDNTAAEQTEEVTIDLYLEFYGAEANADNVKKVKDGIEKVWGGKTTTDGKKLKVEVHTRTSAGAADAPGTAGYHQIKLDNAEKESYVTNFGNFGPNNGTGGGVFETAGYSDDMLAKIFAHEAGHLMGIVDRYDNFDREADGSWTRTADGQSFTTDQMADLLAPTNPGLSKDDLKNWLNDPGTTRASVEQAGSENDLMATLDGEVNQKDVDALVQNVGITVKVEPGDILVNKNDNDQNLAVTGTTSLYVPPGEKKKLEGLYTACIDAHDGSPDSGQYYDIAPRLDAWVGIEAAQVLHQLVRYIDANDLYCGNQYVAQYAVWRVTDNENMDNDIVQAFLQDAGIELGTTSLDFPRMSSPAPDTPEPAVLVPAELFVATIRPGGVLTSVLGRVELRVELGIPVDGYTPAYTWTLAAPPGSAAALSDPHADHVAFVPDVRGLYGVTVAVTFTGQGGTVVEAPPRSAVVAAADAMTDTFERTVLRDHGFRWVTADPGAWTTTTAAANSGGYAARSGDVDDDEETRLEIMVELPEADAVSFAYRVSSESGYDELAFSIDGEEQASWSGQTGWAQARFALSVGLHTLAWTYRKDGSVSEGEDGAWIDDVFFPARAVITAAEPAAETPAAYRLLANYPNPFNPSTQLAFDLPAPEAVRLTVHDALGRTVAVLIDGPRPAGRHAVAFDAEALPSGLYFYTLEAGAYRATRKMLLVK